MRRFVWVLRTALASDHEYGKQIAKKIAKARQAARTK